MENLQKSPQIVFKRILLLYGAYMLLNNAAYLFGYYFLPEGFMRSSHLLSVKHLKFQHG